MENIVNHSYLSAQLTDSEFNTLSVFIKDNFGIKLPHAKKVILQSRLHKRLRALEIGTFKEYITYLFSNDGIKSELIHMMDVVSTNKTDFFREKVHFDFIWDHILPKHFSKESGNRDLQIWSAGCSSGEEPYSTAMMLEEYSKNINPINYNIYAVDLSTDMLTKGANAIYTEQQLNDIPQIYKKKYLLKSKDKSSNLVRIKKEIRNKIQFQRLNLMDKDYKIATKFDIVFCRNTLIYFDRSTQEKVINNLCKNLKIGGYLFIGHSESLMNMNVPLKQIKPTIFQRI
jgi:chemotaxis protein methyltransferase CheR